MDRGEDVVFHDPLGDQDGVFEVVAIPRHERDEHVATERQVTQIRRRTVSNDVALGNDVAHAHDRTLVDTGVLVRPAELRETIDINARLGAFEIFGGANHDPHCVDLLDHTGAAGRDGGAAVASHNGFHAGADEWRFGLDQRHSLTLHVRSHERAVGVIVFEVRNQRGSHRDNLFRRDVHELDVVARHHGRFASHTGVDEFIRQHALLVHGRIGLRDGIDALFHGRQVDHFIGLLAVHDLAVRALDEAVLVDAGMSRQ